MFGFRILKEITDQKRRADRKLTAKYSIARAWRKYHIRKMISGIMQHVTDRRAMRAAVEKEDERLFLARWEQRRVLEAAEMEEYKARELLRRSVASTEEAALLSPRMISITWREDGGCGKTFDIKVPLAAPVPTVPLSASAHFLEQVERAESQRKKQQLHAANISGRTKTPQNPKASRSSNSSTGPGSRRSRTPALIGPLNADPSSVSDIKTLRERIASDPEYARNRPDLAPFSTMINKLLDSKVLFHHSSWEDEARIDEREVQAKQNTKSAAYKALEKLSGLSEQDIKKAKLDSSNSESTNKFKQFGSSIISL